MNTLIEDINLLPNNVIFKIFYKNRYNQDIVNSVIEIIYENNSIMYNVVKYLGSGTVGKVYLIESFIFTNNQKQKYVIKIANTNCNSDLKIEFKFHKKYFKKYNITHASQPLMFGKITKTDTNVLVYNYLGDYNLETLKKNNYIISFTNVQLITRQLIEQILLFNNNNIIHCDLKPPNIVINTDTLIVTIIDFGLAALISMPTFIYSTCYIVSPESLLTTEKYSNCLIDLETIDISKHDNYGLFSIIINLIINKSIWNCFYTYFYEIVEIEKSILDKDDIDELFIYCWYRFYYDTVDEITNIPLQNIIKIIDIYYPKIKNKPFMNFDNFFDIFLTSHIDHESFNNEYYSLLKDFLKKLIHFDYKQRYSIQQLSNHPFLSSLNT